MKSGRFWTSAMLLALAMMPLIGIIWPSAYEYDGQEKIGLSTVWSSPHFEMIRKALTEATIMAAFAFAIFLIALFGLLDFRSLPLLKIASALLLGAFFVAPMVRAFFFPAVLEWIGLRSFDRVVLMVWAQAYFFGFFLITLLGLWATDSFSKAVFSISELSDAKWRVWHLLPVLWAPLVAAFVAVLSFSFSVGGEAKHIARNFYPASYGITSLLGGKTEPLAIYLSLVILSFVLILAGIFSYLARRLVRRG